MLCYLIAPQRMKTLGKNCFNDVLLDYRPCAMVCVGYADHHLYMVYNTIFMQLNLGNCLNVVVWHRPTTNNKQHTQTEYIQLATRLWVQLQMQPNIFLNWGVQGLEGTLMR